MSGFVEWIDKRVNDYALFKEDNAFSEMDIIDTSKLPHPKEEILDALIVSMILGEDVELEEALVIFSKDALSLAKFQEGVGPKILGFTGISTPDLLKLGESIKNYEQLNEKEKNALKNTFNGTEEEQEKYFEFEALVMKETQIIQAKLELAIKLRESSDSDRLKGVKALTNLPSSITGKKVFDEDKVEFKKKKNFNFLKFNSILNIIRNNILDILKDGLLLWCLDHPKICGVIFWSWLIYMVLTE